MAMIRCATINRNRAGSSPRVIPDGMLARGHNGEPNRRGESLGGRDAFLPVQVESKKLFCLKITYTQIA